ncbi:MAG: hypothetical protein ACOYBQ_09435 [Fluviibacter sp.]
MSHQFHLLDRHIKHSQRLSADKIYVITEEVRVKKNVKLTVEDGVTILIQNGLKPKSRTQRAALIFEKGSKLRAQRLYVKACTIDFRQTKIPDNGGLWFLGNFQSAEKDGIHTKVKRKSSLSSFKADMIATYYLGRLDPTPSTPHLNDIDDDIDGLSVMGVGPAEWSISEVRSYYSADDGIDLTNSHIRLNRLRIQAPTEDGINLSSSRLEVCRSLKLDVAKTKSKDRDLVDFETDDGASFLILHAQCQLDLNGVFGDEIALASKEMPRANRRANNESNYQFKGALKSPALIYSLNED